MADELEQAGKTADALRADIELLFVRGLSTATAKDCKNIAARAQEWDRVGAHHIAGGVTRALESVERAAKDAPRRLLSAYTSLHGFERLVSIESARLTWRAYLQAHPELSQSPAQPPLAVAPAAAGPALADEKGATALLTELAKLVEDLVRTGLTSATQATRAKLDSAFKEASRRKLLRLGASLRYVNEEVGRFIADDGSFASKRYAFFLHRSWLLSRGISTALERADLALLGSLAAGAGNAPEPVGALETVTLGVGKRVVASACSFDFRLRVISAKDERWLGKSLIYSLVFARKNDVPAEAFLHLPQPQKFAPKIFCESASVKLSEASIIADDRGGGRLLLTAKSTATPGAAFDDWQRFLVWDPVAVARRAESHRPTPLDLAIELQEEVLLTEWNLVRSTDGGLLIGDRALVLSVALPNGDAGEELAKRLDGKKRKKPPLYGVLHYEFGKLVFSPLAYLHEQGPEHLLLSNENINLSALLGTLDLG